MTIYVVVLVTFDHYRIQMNVGATTHKKQAQQIAELHSGGKLPIVWSKYASYNVYKDAGQTHVLIERYECNAEDSDSLSARSRNQTGDA